MKNIDNPFSVEKDISLRDEFLRYSAFWPIFAVSLLFFVISSLIYLRYAEYKFKSYAKIEIIDKSQDSEMALPTAMTIFNRSMINLENEVGVLSSYSLHKKIASKLNSNISYFSVGRIKTSELHDSEFFDDYEINFKVDTDKISEMSSYQISFENGMLIKKFDQFDNLVQSYSFKNFDTYTINHDLPFDIKVRDSNGLDFTRIIKFYPIDYAIDKFRELTIITPTGQESDQLDIAMKYPNKIIADEYLNTLISEFDIDGITDRQLEYKRTIDFVNDRSVLLKDELRKIELSKQIFKEQNNLSDISINANASINQRFEYDAELFDAKSQKDLVVSLNKSLLNNPLKLMPINIGIDDSSINQLITEYNLLIKQRDKFLISAGINNPYVKNLEKNISDISDNIINSIKNYEKRLDLVIENLNIKENEYANIYQSIPENEKILRSIERELEIKESLFLLLLQKKEEAAINFAVVKPSIKIIDHARSLEYPVSPNKILIFLGALFIGFILPFLFLYISFLYDTKIHNRNDISDRLNIPIIGEVPFLDDDKKTKIISDANSRDPLSESIRMIIANLNFVLFDDKLNRDKNMLLVTSSIKGEGKTIVSTNIASILSAKFSKILLIGADLRNPQIHKFIGLDKSTKGLSDYIYNKNLSWKDIIIKHGNLDILLSGTIPPNPTELLSSNKFSDFINEVRGCYDYIVIDSAPCLLVSDTFEISKHIDTTLYVVRSNFSDIELCSFINECDKEEKLPNINIILNSVGNSKLYGYNYSYNYSYKYGYKYGYNYGYGYGYSEDKNS